jgi:pectin methylesterase-like acyl-CoA thioesterase
MECDMTYRGYPDPLVIHVRTSPGPGEFSTIQAAIASITDNSPTKPYVVDVDPGTWTITTTIVMKPYVNLQGATELTVLSWDGAASGHLIRGAPNTQIRDCILTNAIGVGATGYTIWYDGTSTDPQNPDPAGIAESFNLMDCGFGTAGKLGWVDGSVNLSVKETAS